jgi:hypothetical protein
MFCRPSLAKPKDVEHVITQIQTYFHSVITAKKLYYNNLLIKSNNKIKTTWNIVKTVTNNRGPTNNISTMNINDKLSSNPLVIADAFNSYFSSIV